MDHSSLDTILADIYAVDATLRERDAEVRPLVEALLSHVPDATPRPEFIASLRRELLKEAPASVRSHIGRTWNWWLVHALPVGAVALVALTLIPQLHEPVTVPTQEETFTPSTPSIDTRTFIVPPVGGGESAKSAPAFQSESVSTFDNAVSNETTRIRVATQMSGILVTVDSVTLDAPGFLVVTRGGDTSDSVGVSPLLTIGTTARVPVRLSVRMMPGEVYTVTLYRDNGSARFEEALDTPAFDSETGTLIQTTFTVRG